MRHEGVAHVLDRCVHRALRLGAWILGKSGNGGVGRVELRHELLVFGFEPLDQRLGPGARRRDRGKELLVLTFVVVVKQADERAPALDEHRRERVGVTSLGCADEAVKRSAQRLVHRQVQAVVCLLFSHGKRP
jgi:hypothetical protein